MEPDGDLNQQLSPERYIVEPDVHDTGDVAPGGLAPELLEGDE